MVGSMESDREKIDVFLIFNNESVKRQSLKKVRMLSEA